MLGCWVMADVQYPKDVKEELERHGSGGQVPITPPSGTLSVLGSQSLVQQSAQASTTLAEHGDETYPIPEEQVDPSLALGS